MVNKLFTKISFAAKSEMQTFHYQLFSAWVL